jgi:hypothetical protein
MAPLKQKGFLAELMVAADLRRRGYQISIPFGEDCDYDLWDSTSGTPYYVPSSVFDGFTTLHLRLSPTRNNQNLRIRHAADFLEI